MKSFLFLFVLAFFFSSLTHAQEAIPDKSEDISPLLVGESFPEAKLKNTEGGTVELLKKIGEKNTILIVFRGSWCPYCNRQLGDLQSVEKDLLAAGYQVIAISPDAPSKNKNNTEKNNFSYELYSDDNMAFSKSIGIAYQAPGVITGMLAGASEKANPNLLPVPSVFILDQKGVIKFEYINPNYKERLSGKMLLAIAKALNEEQSK